MKTLIYYKASVLCFFLMLAQGASAVVFEVTTAEEFQSALTAAGASGSDNTIILTGDTYDGNFRFRAELNGNLEITSSNGRMPVINGENKAYGLFLDLKRASYRVVVSNIEIKNGYSRLDGGGLYITANQDLPSQIFLERVNVTDSAADFFGGGIAAHGLNRIEIKESLIEKNLAIRGGGGISIESQTAILNAVRINGNSVEPVAFPGYNGQYAYCYPSSAFPSASPEYDRTAGLNGNPSVHGGGGGVLLWQGDHRIENSQVNRNKIICDGGAAAAIAAVGTIHIVASEIKENEGRYRPIGASTPQSDKRSIPILDAAKDGSSLTDSQVTDNNFSYTSGAPLRRSLFFGDSAVIKGNKFKSNNRIDGAGELVIEADEGRSAFLWVGSDSRLGNSLFIQNNGTTIETGENTRIVGNVVTNTNGIAIRAQGSASLISNTVFGKENAVSIYPKDQSQILLANNIIRNFSTSSITSLYVDNFSDLFGDGFVSEAYNNFWSNVSYDFDQASNNSDQEPKVFNLETHDYHLTEDSPAINAGNNSVLSANENLDLDGNPRNLDGSVDVGAYERSTTALHPADTNRDQSISQAEFAAYNASWRTNDVWATAPSIIPIDFVTRAGYLLEKGGAYKNIGVGKPQTWVPENE